MAAFDIPVLLVPTEFTSNSIPAFAREAESHVIGDGSCLVLDLSAVRFMSSAGLGHLIHVGRTLHEGGGALALASGNRTMTRLLTTTGLTRVMPHFRTVREAIAHLRGRRDETP